MKKKKLVYGLMISALAAFAGSANAAITSETVVDFGIVSGRADTVLPPGGAYYGKANVDTGNPATCSENVCVQQNGMVIGTVADTTGPNAHLHGGGSNADRMLAYHNDSGGIYFRTNDASSFRLTSIKLSSPYADNNPFSKYLADGKTLNPDFTQSLDYWEIIGFSEAYNPNISKGNGTDYATRVAYKAIYNGFNDILTFGGDFGAVKAVWLHYAGVPKVADATFNFGMQIDNITVNAAQVTSVPVPAAVWMFGSGLIGLLSFGRKKSALSA